MEKTKNKKVETIKVYLDPEPVLHQALRANTKTQLFMDFDLVINEMKYCWASRNRIDDADMAEIAKLAKVFKDGVEKHFKTEKLTGKFLLREEPVPTKKAKKAKKEA